MTRTLRKLAMPKPVSPSFDGPFNMPAIPALKPEAIMESYGKMFEQIRDLNQSWMSSVQQMVDSNWDLASQLTRCGDPAEAISVCKEWANERRDALIADGKTFSSLCLKLYQNEPTPGVSQPNISPVRAAAGD